MNVDENLYGVRWLAFNSARRWRMVLLAFEIESGVKPQHSKGEGT